ncbi:MAG TPA: toast rack family protein [Bryobacteraceae bacterium]|nr:toast rack family protein [Bryobacteraceae bacterium]
MKPALVAAAAFLLAGCVVDMERTGPEEHETKSIDLDKSEMVRVDLKMGAGELNVNGGSSKLMDADFTYNVASWKPQVTYTSSGFRGNLTIEQPAHSHGGSRAHYRWEVRLNDQVPMDVHAELGAGKATMNLGSLDLRSVRVDMGVGEMRLDLTGKPMRDYTVNINGGVGHAMVFLPRDAGIVANASGGIGNISVRGLEKRGGQWINPAHENAPVTIHLDIQGGIGQIELVAE